MTRAPSQKTIALHSIQIASPCTASWENMTGDDRVRHCGDCNKNVFNLSAMPEADGAALLAGNTDGALCVRFYQRPDGTVMTSDCSTSARAYTRRTLRKVPGMAGAALFAVSFAAGAAAPPIPVVKHTVPVPVPAPIRNEVLTVTMGAPMAQVVLSDKPAPLPARSETEPHVMGKPAHSPFDLPAATDKKTRPSK